MILTRVGLRGVKPPPPPALGTAGQIARNYNWLLEPD